MKRLASVFKFLVLGLAPALYFSYFPVISLGNNETMNFELSVAIIWLVLLDVCGLLLVVMRGELVVICKKWVTRQWMWLLFPVWVTVSVVWSLNVTRGVLTVGLMWAIIVAAVILWERREIFDAKFRRMWLKVFIIATLVICGWCVVQCILDIVGVPREYSLMCEGCVSQMFGFPHPNGLAIEPQFMGNLLIAPAILLLWFMLKAPSAADPEREPSRGRVFHNRSGRPAPVFQYRTRSVTVVKNTSGSGSLCSGLVVLGALIIATTLFLTFSRGAIYAFIVGVVAMGAVAVVKKVGWKRIVAMWSVVVVAFVAALNIQGLMAELGPTDDTYFTGITKVLNHLSLGTIDVHAAPAVFDGYVAESTDTRVRLANDAFLVWRSDFKAMAFGVGIGGAGEALYQKGLSDSPKEIVQNEYVTLLLETGVVGVVLVVVMLVMMLRFAVRRRSVLVMCLILSYAATLLFFSGLANALQVYLMPVLLVIFVDKKYLHFEKM